jgi:hypothetical protein
VLSSELACTTKGNPPGGAYTSLFAMIAHGIEGVAAMYESATFHPGAQPGQQRGVVCGVEMHLSHSRAVHYRLYPT